MLKRLPRPALDDGNGGRFPPFLPRAIESRQALFHSRASLCRWLLGALQPWPGAVKSYAARISDAVSASDIAVYFSPRGGCTAAIVDELDRARRSIRVQAYSFASAPIAKALVAAKRRGVDVAILMDKSQRLERYSSGDFVAHAGIATFIDGAHAIAHNKVMIIDGETVLTGSFNFTRAAEDRNAENLLVIHNAALADKYGRNWEEHRSHSESY